MKGLATDVIDIYESWLGQEEIPLGSNCCQNCHDFGPIGGVECYAWCCASASLALDRAGVPGFWTASVAKAKNDAQNKHNGLLWWPGSAKPEAGWFSCFDFGKKGNWADFHISLCVDPAKYSGHSGSFLTIGANEQSTVKYTWRDGKYLMGWIQPAYKDPTPDTIPVPIVMEDNKMFICQFLPEPGIKADDWWFVTPDVAEPGVDKFGTKKLITDKSWVWSFAAQGIRLCPQPVPGAGLYRTV